MSAAAVAAGYLKLQKPPKLVRQRNRLPWQTELALNGFVVVSDYALITFKTDIIVNGKEVSCPPGHTILVDGRCSYKN